jgi:hypothetical protein
MHAVKRAVNFMFVLMFCFGAKYVFLSFVANRFYENVHSMENEIQVNSDVNSEGFGSVGNDQEKLRVRWALLLFV